MTAKERTAIPFEQLKEWYEIEKELASRLRHSSRAERRHLYASLYDELYRRVPMHSQLVRKSASEQTGYIRSQMRFLRRFLKPDVTFLEIGPGDCALSIEAARLVRQVFAVDVSEIITQRAGYPDNFRLILSDGCSVPLPENSVDVAYSNQLMEHLHPDDAVEQLHNIQRVLAPGGVYICITPNRLSGPHDVSKYFETTASGFHLKEYTITELRDAFMAAGFSKVRAYIGLKGIYIAPPVGLLVLWERVLSALPRRVRRVVANDVPTRLLLRARIVGVK